MTYRPPTQVVTCEMPYLALVTQADPDWAHWKYIEPYFVDGRGRQIYHNPYIDGAYGRRDNTYPVGQQYGGLDPLIINNLAPTVGNPIPGLYSGIPTGSWA